MYIFAVRGDEMLNLANVNYYYGIRLKLGCYAKYGFEKKG